ncbi:MAG TPA: S8 family serine peptidase [Planctomycetota bacterium]
MPTPSLLARSAAPFLLSIAIAQSELPDDRLHFALAKFDPLQGEPQFAGHLGAPAGTRLFVVQFLTRIGAEHRALLAAHGVQVLGYVPRDAFTVRCDAAVAAKLLAMPAVRWVGALQNAFKLDAELRTFAAGNGAARECNLVLATKADRPVLAAQVAEIGGTVTDLCDGSTMIRATLTPSQLVAVMSRDTMVWADPVTAIGFDLDNARIQGGANYVEAAGGFRGQGVRVEATEGLEEGHVDFAGRVLLRGTNTVTDHGHCVAGCLAGSGAGTAGARSILPQCDVVEGAYLSAALHYAQITGSTNPTLPWRVMVASSSWGSAMTSSYTSVSMTLDDALFDADLTRCQAHGNGVVPNSRPEAWAKNVISVGGVTHGDNAIPGDDTSPGSSAGPAADGRIKPDACAYQDAVLTSDRTGAAGFAPGDAFAAFAGTSASAPIVAGHVGIIHQMFTDGLFGNVLPLPPAPQNRFDNRPHMSTSKALLCGTATPYPIAQIARHQQGWGFPALDRLWDNRKKILVVDEYDALQANQSRSYWVWVAPGTTDFRATMVYTEPAGNPAVATQLVNDANLRVTHFASGLYWWGNNGLNGANVSTSGGSPQAIDNIESVWLANPVPGIYLVSVAAASIATDAKVETPQLDLDYALVVHPLGGGYHDDTGTALDLISTGPGNLTIAAANVPPSGWTSGHVALSFDTARGRGFGRFFGIEDDAITVALWTSAAGPGNPFHFTPAGPGQFPFTTYVFPLPGLISLLAGLQVDAVMTLFDANGDIVAQSNVDRLLLQ